MPLFGWSRTLRLRLRSLFRPQAADRDLDDELRYHLDLKTEENIARDMTPEEARRAAQISLGGVEQVKEQIRAARTGAWLGTLAQDVRFGLRMLRKNPGFTVVAVLTLALGLGANTAIFSVVNALILRPLPIFKPQQVVALKFFDKAGSGDGFSFADFQDIRGETAALFSGLAGAVPFKNDGLVTNGSSQPISVCFVTTNFFQVMGIHPVLGSFFGASNGTLAASDPVLVLGYSYWKSRFGADPRMIGQAVILNGQPVTIIGVAPKGFKGITAITDLQGYAPIGMITRTSNDPPNFFADREWNAISVIGRLRPGVNRSETSPPLTVIARQLSRRYPRIHDWDSIQALPLGPLGPESSLDSNVRQVAALFLALVGLILVLACANIATLFLVRATARRRELALRSALGAGRLRLARQLLTESCLLALLGCVAGILIGFIASRMLGSVNLSNPSAVPFSFSFDFDWRVFAYTFGSAALAGILVGVAPAMRPMRGHWNDLVHGKAGGAGNVQQRARRAVVVAQLGVSLALLIIAGLFVRSLLAAAHRDLGFDAAHVVTLSIETGEAGYHESQARQVFQELLARTRGLPDVQSASLAATVPFSYYTLGVRDFKVEGYNLPPSQQPLLAAYNAVSPDYFDTLRIPIIRGRTFLASDTQNSPYVAIINERMAKMFWPRTYALGGRFTVAADPGHPIMVVGIAKDSYTASISAGIQPYFYRPLAQDYQPSLVLLVRTNLANATAVRDTVSMIHSLDPNLPVMDARSMTDALDNLNGLLLYKVAAVIAGCLGLAGFALAVVGVYGVISYSAIQLTHEIGIRIALGAHPDNILRMVIGQAFILTAVGLVLGILLAGAIGTVANRFLLGVSSTDPVTYICASMLLASVALLACYIPARRATRVDPMIALRHE